jgi:alpha-tubulin suppressor-like RCC1 family protein
MVSAGTHTCGVTTDHRAFCWGGNDQGELGNGTTAGTNRPVAVAGGLQFDHVSVGWGYTCGVTTDGQGWCWGSNYKAMLGDGTQTSRSVPVPVAGAHRFRQLRAYNVHTCGVTTNDEAYCWGANNAGQLGVGTDVVIRRRPARVDGTRKWRPARRRRPPYLRHDDRQPRLLLGMGRPRPNR